MTTQRYRRRPQEVEAIQWTGHNLDEVLDFNPELQGGRDGEALLMLADQDGVQGHVEVPVGHWIVRQPGMHYDHWPVDPDYFAIKYEPVGDEQESGQ